MSKLSTGSKPLDILLAGGYEKGVITTIYGESGSGKSNICMLSALAASKQAKKVVYVDTEGGFSAERASQLFPKDYEKLIENMIFFNPTSFEEQKEAFDQIKDAAAQSRLGLVIVDSIVMLYRLAKGTEEEVSNVNRELARQLRILSEIARKYDVPVLVTNQVYADFNNPDNVRMVGGDLLKYWSKAIVKLAKEDGSICSAAIYKHRSLPQKRAVCFEIKNSGLVEAQKPKKKFSLFN
jgi:DNA repair protein RadB